jgi:hypothetical protein
MALKICGKGHLTGTRNCGRCGSDKTVTVKGPPPASRFHWTWRVAFDKLTKRLITKGLREIGYPVVADL